jgi:hypothetical protein
MKTEMRRVLAREPYEKKIQKVEQLVRLVREFPRQLKRSVSKMRAKSPRTSPSRRSSNEG